ncbi:MAG: glycosyltransferase family 4 protein, partial [Candidatus Thorarchaeota archaeon]
MVSDVIYPWNKGGAEKRYHEVYRRLARKHDVHYFTMRYPGMKSDFRYKGISVHAVSKGPSDLYTSSRRRIGPAIRFSILLFFSLMKYRFDIIDSNEFPHFPNISVKLYTIFYPKTRFYSTWHEHWSFHYWLRYLGFFGGFIGFILQSISAKMPGKIISVSENTKNDLIVSRAVANGRIFVIGNGIDYESIEEALSDYSPQRGTIVFVGRLIPEKRVDLLIRLFEHINKTYPSTMLKIVGGGPEMENLKRIAGSESIEFTGYIESHIEVLKHIVGASAFVSMSEREGFNISALEACEMGVPTFARLVCFEHPNLHRLSPANIEELENVLNSSVTPERRFNAAYS